MQRACCLPPRCAAELGVLAPLPPTCPWPQKIICTVNVGVEESPQGRDSNCHIRRPFMAVRRGREQRRAGLAGVVHGGGACSALPQRSFPSSCWPTLPPAFPSRFPAAQYCLKCDPTGLRCLPPAQGGGCTASRSIDPDGLCSFNCKA